MTISVVICTVDRGPELRATLAALRHQTYASFEVVVVAGPSHDDTDDVLREAGDAVRVVRNPEVHISKSRNLGIDAAAGELVAFIDDDAIPEPRWLERLGGAMRDPAVGGAGGFVRLPDGTGFQQRWGVCSRAGEHVQLDTPPAAEHAQPQADPFAYILGTNACFRRTVLELVEGYDEEIEYYHDETDLCARTIDAGHPIVQVEGAEVIHRIRPSGLRDASRRVTDPYAVVKNHVYFARMQGSAAADASIARWTAYWRDEAAAAHAAGAIGEAERTCAVARVDDGVAAGEAAAARGTRRTRPIAPPEPSRFRAYPRVPSPEPPRRAAFVSSEYPPAAFGGIGRYTQTLATGLSAAGWEAHVVVPGGAPSALVDFEDGVWVHRVPARRVTAALPHDAVSEALDRTAAAYGALLDIESRYGAIDVVSAPLWSGEALLPELDPRWAAMTTLMTTMRTVVDLYPDWPHAVTVRLLDLEAETLRQASRMHAISRAILEQVREDYPQETAQTPADVVHLGVADRRNGAAPPLDRPGARILFVGRLERRKGVGSLLDAAASLLRRHPEAELVLVGRDVEGYGERFAQHYDDDPELRRRVVFAGAVDDARLAAAYAEADVFVAPSLYESFGLVHAEAMMMGLPVVACSAGGMVELVEDGVTGLLVPPGDAGALEQALEGLLCDPVRRRAMARAGRVRYERQFAVDHAVRQTAIAYSAAADARDRRPVADATLVRRLAETLERVTGQGPAAAHQLASAMLRGGDDPLGRIRTVWQADDESFVDGVYQALLARAPEPSIRDHLLHQLRIGRRRGDVVREVGWSDEARSGDADVAWLGRLLELEGWTHEESCAAAFAAPSDERFVLDIVDLLVEHVGDRELGRQLVRERLDAGDSRLLASIALLRSELAIRPAPDFEGWEPILMTLGSSAGQDAESSSRDSALKEVAAAATRQARRVLRVPRRLRQTVNAIRETNVRAYDASVAIGRMEAQLRELAAQRPDGEGDVQGRLSYLAERMSELVGSNVEVGTNIAATRAELGDAVGRTKSRAEDNAAMIDLLQRKLDAVAVDLRDRLPPMPSPADLPEPVIPDPDAYDRLVTEQGTCLRVNLGAGEKPVAGYINVDARALDGIDVVADVRRLPFEPGTLAEIASAHLVEHFREHQLEVSVLPYWHSLLRPGGVVRVICPNWQEMADRLARGEMDWTTFKVLTFGLQDYDGDDHLAMYTPAHLEATLRSVGFVDVALEVPVRMNGMCPEMEITARTSSTGDGDEARS